MKALRLISIILVAGICFSACEREKTPESVAEKFLNYLEEGEFNKAKDLGTQNTHTILETLQAFEDLGEQFGETEKEEPRNITDVECNVEGDVAKCTYMADDEKGELDLVKQDGKWLVDMKKESPFDEEAFDEGLEDLEEDLEDLEEDIEEIEL